MYLWLCLCLTKVSTHHTFFQFSCLFSFPSLFEYDLWRNQHFASTQQSNKRLQSWFITVDVGTFALTAADRLKINLLFFFFFYYKCLKNKLCSPQLRLVFPPEAPCSAHDSLLQSSPAPSALCRFKLNANPTIPNTSIRQSPVVYNCIAGQITSTTFASGKKRLPHTVHLICN